MSELVGRLRANADPRCHQHIPSLSLEAAALIERQAGLIQTAINALYRSRPYLEDAVNGHLVLRENQGWIDEGLLQKDFDYVKETLAKLEAENVDA